jgi:anti-anti-sigma factor
MKIRVREMEDVAVVTVEGNIMQEYVSVFRTRLDDLIERQKVKIVLQLADSSYISSLCLAVIVDAKNRTTARGGDIRIACTNKLITNLLEITNLHKKIDLYDTLDAALSSYGLQTPVPSPSGEEG